MRKLSIFGLLLIAACQGGNSSSGSNALLEENGGEQNADGTMNDEPGGMTTEGENDKCTELRTRLDACWQQNAPSCESANTALSQCYEQVDTGCRSSYEALEACKLAMNSDCSQEIAAVESCQTQYESCRSLEEQAWSCGAECFDLEQQVFAACEPPPPPEASYCVHLYEALSLCQSEAAQTCGRNEMDPNGMVAPDGADCFARCSSIEVAIAELCAPPPEPCDQPQHDPGMTDPNGGGENQGEPDGSERPDPNGM
jgi:hypothetical protein